jgi:hypothetical protein
MSERGIGGRKARRRGNKRRFIQLWTNVKRSAAYHGLGCHARAALIELLDRYHGINNGMIVLSVRELAHELRCGVDTARRALVELDDAGLVQPITGGRWKGKRATEWRLTFYRCDKTGELPACDWKLRQVYDGGYTKVRLQVHKAPKCTATGTHNRNSPMNDPVKCTATGTHIDIYQGDRETDKRSECQHDASMVPSVIEFPKTPKKVRRRGLGVKKLEAIQAEYQRIAKKIARREP